MNEDKARRIRQQADAEFAAGLQGISSDTSKPQEMRDRAMALYAKFMTLWIIPGRSGDPMTAEQRRHFYTVDGTNS